MSYVSLYCVTELLHGIFTEGRKNLISYNTLHLLAQTHSLYYQSYSWT